MDEVKREPGFYWVKSRGEWTVGEWYGRDWALVDTDASFDDDYFDEIGSRLTPPGEETK